MSNNRKHNKKNLPHGKLEDRINISNAVFDPEKKTLRVKGWRLTQGAVKNVIISSEEHGILGVVEAGEERLDVFADHPEYDDKYAGWTFETTASQISSADSIRAHMINDGREKRYKAKVKIKNAPVTPQESAQPPKQKSTELLFTKAVFDEKRKRIFLQAIIVHGSNFQKVRFEASSGWVVPDNMVVKSHSVPGEKVKWEAEILCPAAIDKEVFTASVIDDDSIITQTQALSVTNISAHIAPQISLPNESQNKMCVQDYAWFLENVTQKKGMKFEDLKKQVVYYPCFQSTEDLGNHFSRASWYLTGTGSPVSRVTFGVAKKDLRPDHAPDHFADLSKENTSNLQFVSDDQDYLNDLRTSRVILVWQSLSASALTALRKQYPAAKILPVCTDDVEAAEYGNYSKVQWTMLDGAERNALIEDSRARLTEKIEKIKASGIDKAAVFGTGPSLDAAFKFDFEDCCTVVCNSIINSPKLLEHIKPAFITAGDVVSHFGVSKYAAKFREDLVKFLQKWNCDFFTTSDFGYLLLVKYPELKDKIIFCQQKANGPIVDLTKTFALPKLDSTLNIHMLPLASTVADKVFILGCDGKDPDPAKNEDFWSHSSLAQYHDLVETGHKSHPTFDQRRQVVTHERFVNSTADFLATGEFLGRSYYSLKPSFTPGIKSRPVPEGMLEKGGDGRYRLLTRNSACLEPPENVQHVLITARVNPVNFSGGRYHAFLMAEAIAMQGHKVTMWIDNVPKWYFNLALLPGHPNIELHVNSFSRKPKGKFDWVIVTPDFSDSPDLYLESLRLAKRQRAKVGLINFESPNWFNENLENKRPEERWHHWRSTAHFADVIISSAEISSRYAKAYYLPANSDLNYVSVPPAINSAAADLVRARKLEKKKQIVCISRFGKDAAHKNIEGLLELLSDATRGYTLALIVGTGDLPSAEQEADLHRKFAEHDVHLSLLHNISDIEKFEVIGSSECMVFQSLFEGFGYPPVEAQYMDCPCVAYDLPVLREFSDGYVNFVEHGDAEEMREMIAHVLKGEKATPDDLYPNVADLGSVEKFGERLRDALFDATAIPGGNVAQFSTEAFLKNSETYKNGQTVASDPRSCADGTNETLAKLFREMAAELEKLSK